MKKIIFITLTIIVCSCKPEAKKETPKELNENITPPKEVVNDIPEYPDTEDLLEDIIPIFTEGYEFTDAIGIEQIGVVNTGENTYKLVYFLTKNSDFKAIEELNIAFRVYPKDLDLFANQADKNAKAKTIASKCDIRNMEGDLVIVSEEFSIIPKEFEQVRVYFYHPKDGVIGEMITVLDVRF